MSLVASSASSSAPAKSYFVRTFGCQMNEHDSERIAGLLAAEGMGAVSDAGEADVIVVNTCCIREKADQKLYSYLGSLKHFKGARPGMQIAVGGCLAQKDRDLIRQKAPHVDVVFGTHNVHRAAELLALAASDGPIVEILEETARSDAEAFPSVLPAERESSFCAWVTIQIGCDNTCAFCIVPAVRGPEISRPFDAVLEEVRELADRGVVEVTLLGQNVNSYGRDLALAQRRAGERVRVRPMFAELLRAVGSVPGIRRVRYTSPHPKDLRPETLSAMAETPAVCEHLHLPLQSGSDAVLAAMHRGYGAERYLQRLAEARRAIPDLAVSTDIIVGFPGETEEDFARTLEVVAEAEYDSAFTFVFSPRPGTEAERMTEKFVDADAAADRYKRLRAVVERSARRRHSERIGRREEVLVEGPSKTRPELCSGRTRQNKLVHFAAGEAGEAGKTGGSREAGENGEALLPGAFAEVEIVDAGSHYLLGELVEVKSSAPQRPSQRNRIAPPFLPLSPRKLIPVAPR